VRRDETFTVGEHVLLDVELPGGDILLRSGVSGAVSISIEASAADSFDVGQLGDCISIRASRRSRSARLVVDVPTGTDVTVKGASVDVAAPGALGALRVQSASGDVAAEDLVRVDVSVVSGSIRLELVRDNASFTATSGDVVVGSIGGRLVATLKSGDLNINEVGGDAEVQSASGDVTIRRCEGSTVTVRTLSGDIHLGLPSGIRVDPEISTLSGTVSLPDRGGTYSAAGSPPTAQRRSVKVRLRSVSGDIRIERA
jgi:DUF4097 and DUF4098 domain-containing protein YvlB